MSSKSSAAAYLHVHIIFSSLCLTFKKNIYIQCILVKSTLISTPTKAFRDYKASDQHGRVDVFGVIRPCNVNCYRGVRKCLYMGKG